MLGNGEICRTLWLFGDYAEVVTSICCSLSMDNTACIVILCDEILPIDSLPVASWCAQVFAMIVCENVTTAGIQEHFIHGSYSVLMDNASYQTALDNNFSLCRIKGTANCIVAEQSIVPTCRTRNTFSVFSMAHLLPVKNAELASEASWPWM